MTSHFNHLPFMEQAALGGMTADETVTKCWATKATAMDFCPLIWKNFSALNYVTALVEDSPGLASFNYAKTGGCLGVTGSGKKIQ